MSNIYTVDVSLYIQISYLVNHSQSMRAGMKPNLENLPLHRAQMAVQCSFARGFTGSRNPGSFDQLTKRKGHSQNFCRTPPKYTEVSPCTFEVES